MVSVIEFVGLIASLEQWSLSNCSIYNGMYNKEIKRMVRFISPFTGSLLSQKSLCDYITELRILLHYRTLMTHLSPQQPSHPASAFRTHYQVCTSCMIKHYIECTVLIRFKATLKNNYVLRFNVVLMYMYTHKKRISL